MNLDDAYANGAYIAGAADYPPRWQTQAAAFRAGLGDRARLDLRYGPGDRHRFDLFTPTGAAPRGTVIFIHGGYWRAFDKSSWSHLAAGPLARGWAVAMPSYDLCPQVRIDRITLQIRDAVQAVADLCPGRCRSPAIPPVATCRPACWTARFCRSRLRHGCITFCQFRLCPILIRYVTRR